VVGAAVRVVHQPSGDLGVGHLPAGPVLCRFQPAVADFGLGPAPQFSRQGRQVGVVVAEDREGVAPVRLGAVLVEFQGDAGRNPAHSVVHPDFSPVRSGEHDGARNRGQQGQPSGFRGLPSGLGAPARAVCGGAWGGVREPDVGVRLGSVQRFAADSQTYSDNCGEFDYKYD
jgi:hypothetical protein